MTVIGSGYIRLLPQTTGFAEAAKAQLQPELDALAATSAEGLEAAGGDAGAGMAAGLGAGAKAAESDVENAGEDLAAAGGRGLGKLEGEAATEGEKAGKSLGGGVSKGISGLLSTLSSAALPFGPFGAAAEKAGAQVEKASEEAGPGGLMGTLDKLGGVTLLAGTAAFAAFAGESAHLAMEFQSSTASLAAQGGISVNTAKDIGNAFLDTGGTTVFTGQQMVQAITPVAGVLKELNGGVLNSATALNVMKASGDLAEATNGSLDSTTSALVKTMQAYGLSASQAAPTADTLFSASQQLGVGVDSVAQAATRLKSKLGDAAPSLQQTAGLMVDLTNHGETGRAAITATNTAFQNLITAADPTTKAQEKINQNFADMGIKLTDANGNFIGLSGVLDQLAPKMVGLNSTQQTALLTTLGFGSSAKALASTFAAGAPVLDTYTASVSKSGSAHDAAQKQASTLEHQFELLKAEVIDDATKFGQVLLPILIDVGKAFVQAGTYVLNHKDLLIALGVVVGGVLTVAIATFTVNTMAGFISSMKDAVTNVTTLFGKLADTSGVTAAEGAVDAANPGVETLGVNLNAAAEAAANLTAALSAIPGEVGGTGAAASTAAPELDALATAEAAAAANADLIAANAAGAVTGMEAIGTAAVTTEGQVAGVGTAAEGAGAAAGVGFGGMLGPIGLVALGVGGLYLGISKITSALGQVQGADQINALAQSVNNLPANNVFQMETSLDNLTHSINAMATGGQSGFHVLNQAALDGSAAAQKIALEYVTLKDGIAQTNANQAILASTFGISKAAAQQLAQTTGIDLTKALDPTKVQIFSQALQQNQTQVDTSKAKVLGLATETQADMVAMASAAQTNLPQIVNSANSAASGASSIFKNFDWGSTGAAMPAGVATGVTNNEGKALDAMKKLASDAQATPVPDMSGLGGGMATGTASGITANAGAVQAALAGVVTNAVNNVKHSLGIFSPSTVLADEVGLPMAQGIAVGFVSGAAMGAITSAAGTLAAHAQSTVRSAFTAVGTSTNTSGIGPSAPGAGTSDPASTLIQILTVLTAQNQLIQQLINEEKAPKQIALTSPLPGVSGQQIATGTVR